jgi:hypothetical protein
MHEALSSNTSTKEEERGGGGGKSEGRGGEGNIIMRPTENC